MFPIPPHATGVAQVADIIQTAIAPVFLFAGVSGFLNVLTGRLSRIVDRARELEPLLLGSTGAEHEKHLTAIRTIDRRIALIGRAIWLSVLAALLLCFIVVLLFAGTLVHGHFGTAISLLFILCMVLLGISFGHFLIETSIGARAVRVRNALLEHEAEEI